MGFMQKQVTGLVRWLRVETDQGTEFLSVYDTGFDWPDSSSTIWDAQAPDNLQSAFESLRQYCDGEPESWENIKGYGARLSAPGYLDCTEWTVFDTPEEAEQYLEEMYGDEDSEETEG